MTKLTPQQESAVYSVDNNVLVAAGAGSGKTHVLVERYVEILRKNQAVNPDMIIAVTFTRKAAGEMRNRLKAKFKELAETDKENSDRWQGCLQDIDQAKIGTIHSLCESILKAFPAEAKIDPQFEVIDDVLKNEIIDESVTEALRVAISENSDEKSILEDMNFDDIHRWILKGINSSIQFRESFEQMVSLDNDELLNYMNRVRHEIQLALIRDVIYSQKWQEKITFIDSSVATGKLEETRQLVLDIHSDIGMTLNNEELSDTKVSAALWNRLLSFKEINLRGGGRDELSKDIKAAIKSLKTMAQDCFLSGSGSSAFELPAELTEKDVEQFKYCHWLVKLFKRANQIYFLKKQEELLLDYDDMIYRAANLLHEPDSVARKYFHDRLHAILVDEFQDTNSMQAEVVSLLAGKQTRLFLIGDDKQSIYKFQGADVSTFNSWRDHMKGAGQKDSVGKNLSGENQSLKLTASFRSHPKIVNLVNYVFNKIFGGANEEISYRALFEPLDATRKNTSTDKSEFENINVVITPSADDMDSSEKERLESLSVADWILDKINSGAPLINADGEIERTLSFGDFAILVPQNKDFEAIEYGLDKRKIPYSVFAGRGFLNRQEIIDIENVMRFLANNLDSHSLLGVLRSPMFAVSDDVLHEVVTTSNKKSLWAKVQSTEMISQSGYENLAKAVNTLKHLIVDSASLNLAELVRKIIIRTNIELVHLSGPKGTQRARNLFKIISMARDYEHLSCGEFANQLNQMREFNIKQSDAPVGTSDSVKVMTIHASKGLEFPCVALPSLGGSLTKYSGKLIFHPTYGVAINSERDTRAPKPPWYGYTLKLDKEMELYERRRLLYVAMTRARDYLGIFLDQESRNKESFRSWILSSLDMELSEITDNAERFELNQDGFNATFNAGLYGYDEMAEEDETEEPPKELKLSIIKSESIEEEVTNLSLVEPIRGTPVDLSNIWPESKRITPSSKGTIQLEGNLVGNYFHKLMESLVSLNEMPDREFLENVAFDMGVLISHPAKRKLLIDEGEKLLKYFFESKLHTMMIMARRSFHEFPYLKQAEEDVLSKRPDLILEDEKGDWYVIDFKTDDFHRHDMDTHVNRHRRQINAYVKDLEALTDTKYKPALYFARHGEMVVVDSNIESENSPGKRAGGDSKQLKEQPVQLNLFGE